MSYIKDNDLIEACYKYDEKSDAWKIHVDYNESENSEYRRCVKETMRMCEDVLLKKNKEYADNIHPFHNFQIAAELQDTTLIKALAGMMAKHTSSIYDMCNSKKEYPLEQWNEKIVDHINYLLILRAMVVMSH